MKNLLSIIIMILMMSPIVVFGQEVKEEKKKKNFFKEVYEDFLKYGTIYAAGDIRNAYENSRKDYFVERP